MLHVKKYDLFRFIDFKAFHRLFNNIYKLYQPLNNLAKNEKQHQKFYYSRQKMESEMQMEQHFLKIYKAFLGDGFQLKKRICTAAGKLGVVAEHTTARNYDTGRKKLSYYLEGTPYERGYLLGLLAEPEISDMAVNFVDNIVFDFIGLEFLNRFPLLQKLLIALIYEISLSTWISQPQHVHDEVRGMLDGCKKSNPNTLVTQARISVLNVGFDVLCAMIYTGGFLCQQIPQITPKDICLGMMCNAFSVFGDAAGGGHFFARDFMFPTGGVLQNNLAHILHYPENSDGSTDTLYPHVCIGTPGMVGSVSAMNMRGVAAGLNMSPAANCDTEYIGINSLLLLRESILRGGNAVKAAEVIQSAKRGVAWNYILSDGMNNTACTVEAGASWQDIDFLSYPSKQLLPYLPNAEFLLSNNPVPCINGATIRWYAGPFPEWYFKYNSGLWHDYNDKHDPNIVLYENAFLPEGFINRTPEEKNCPSTFYFAPQRTGRNVFITTNHFLMPHMRLCAMDPWIAQVVQRNTNDIQWRYDELNQQIRQALQEQGSINYQTVKRLADFLAPYGKFPQYYQNNPKSKDGKEFRIKGCVSLFDLKKLAVESHYGYYCDEWVKTSLPAYFGSI